MKAPEIQSDPHDPLLSCHRLLFPGGLLLLLSLSLDVEYKVLSRVFLFPPVGRTPGSVALVLLTTGKQQKEKKQPQRRSEDSRQLVPFLWQ